MVVCSWASRGHAYDYLILLNYTSKPITIDSVSVSPEFGRGSRLNPFKNQRRPIDRAASLILVVFCELVANIVGTWLSLVQTNFWYIENP